MSHILAGSPGREEVEAAWAEHFRRMRFWSRLVRPRPVVWVEAPREIARLPKQARWKDPEWAWVLKRLGGLPDRKAAVSGREEFCAAAAQAARDAVRELDGTRGWTLVDAYLRDRSEVVTLSQNEFLVAQATARWQAIWPRDARDPFASLLAALSGVAAAWVLYESVVCLEKPTEIHGDVAGRLHAEDGPAVEWGDDQDYYWHGVRVRPEVIENPDSLTAERILDEENAEVRRVMVERVGWERVLTRGSAIHTDGDRVLWVMNASGGWDRLITLVQVICPSTSRRYLLRVPPQTQTCEEAVAWTFGLGADGFHPEQET